jgi:cell division protein FtsI/penicillin-binding protein 2
VPRQPAHRHFQELTPASATPRVVTSLDIELQRFVRLELERTLAEHEPVLVQAIVVEVATGRVLAVDAVDSYELAGFLPTMHTFTPGSTMKAIVMATALDEGVVTPEERFRPFGGHFQLGSRTIHEAEGQKKELPWVSAAEGLAYSLNGVLVQIGIRIPGEHLRARFLELGYARYPGSGLGSERCGTLPKWPWSRTWAHASVCFGHEMLVTLWQHAAALATVVRGGEYLPLTLVDRVEHEERSWAIGSAVPRRVFGQEACEAVREMMKLGAREGTGARVYCEDLVMGTKTGTSEKVPGEVCLHVEAQHHMEHAGCHGSKGCRSKLAGQRIHRSCYTSSMCAFGRLPDSDREVLVLVVVDEPRKGKKFGADVAGPAAAAILKEALGYTHGGVRAAPLSAEGLQAFEAGAGELLTERPWMEVSGAAR